MNVATQAGSLRSSLKYEPRGWSSGPADGGARLWISRSWRSISTLLRNWILAVARHVGRSNRPRSGDFFARDLRPSSDSFVPEFEGRGEIAQAIVAALRDAGMRPINLGAIPTPALTCYALARGKGSIMVTGSHIPFDRNGYKTNTSKGELLKQQEAPIHEQVARSARVCTTSRGSISI